MRRKSRLLFTGRVGLCGLIISLLTVVSVTYGKEQAGAGSSSPHRTRKLTKQGVSSLISSLRSQGVAVKQAGRVSQPFFSVRGREIKINNESVQVFEYKNPSAAEREAKQVSPNGSSVGTSMMSWMSTPHFYRKGNLIVLYVGNDSKVLGALSAVLGVQFAGG